MTKKEIIDGLQFTIDMFLSDPLTGEALEKPRNDMDKTTIDACKGAIELLEQQSCYNPDEWCHDCSEYDHDKHCCHRWSKVIRNSVEEMKQPKTGHWIFDEILDRNYYCSECKSMGVDYWDYCPYCGCRMVEPQKRSDKE